MLMIFYYLAAVLSDLAGLFLIFHEHKMAVGLLLLCIGAAMLCFGGAMTNRSAKEQQDEEKQK